MTEPEFEHIFREYFSVLCNVAYPVVKDKDIAKDIVQQVFLKLWDNRNNYQIHSSVRSYLHRAVVNTSLNYLESNKESKTITINQAVEAISDSEPIDNTHNEHLQYKITEAVKALPAQCQIVFSLSRYSEMSNKEIAEHLGISVKAVEKHITKALKELRENLKDLLILILLFYLFTNTPIKECEKKNQNNGRVSNTVYCLI